MIFKLALTLAHTLCGRFAIHWSKSRCTSTIKDANGTTLAANDDWQADPALASQLGFLGLALSDPKESGIYIALPPGAFTAILAGKSGGTGIGLVEIYNVQ